MPTGKLAVIFLVGNSIYGTYFVEGDRIPHIWIVLSMNYHICWKLLADIFSFLNTILSTIYIHQVVFN
ncbi:hypothetical protein F9C07_2156461 [Aspergillus flavus]|uniref:Uncharacterized protein n=1 Tax=Aspergillus flavus (strain ATCC 200026 / FGSC A1120 / IAM 13836 / NRRL 3357 / JCM 12722 / SRRC 167) TaxID=332952 RepID=A0A7U2MU38_ASPFN|nr:hypothetical protein F9C07_2156461 [Aspergillus flavus]